jgi:hypothetical protein
MRIAFVAAFGSDYHNPTEWQSVGDWIKAAFIFARANLLNVPAFHLSRFDPPY